MPALPRHIRPNHRVCTSAAIALTLLAWVAAPVIAQETRPDTPGRHGRPAASSSTDVKSDPYPLATCPVSGQKLGSKGEPVVKTIEGREVRFCCGGCIARFEANSAAYWQKIDKEIVKEQMPFYPLMACPISGETLGGMGEPVDYVYNNRLVRFCCKGCLPKFLENPAPTLKKLDEAVIAEQGKHYPVTTCLVSGETLGEMGGPVERVYDNHLVRFCCKACIRDFEQNPAKFLGMLDEAWEKQGGPQKPGHAKDHDDDDHGRGHGHEEHGH